MVVAPYPRERARVGPNADRLFWLERQVASNNFDTFRSCTRPDRSAYAARAGGMNEDTTTTLIPDLSFTDDYADHLEPQVMVLGDAGGVRFHHSVALTVPKLLYLLEHPGGEGAFTHLGVDVASPFFGEHQDRMHEVAIALDGKQLDKRLFHKWYFRHQFLIPLTSFRRERHQLALTATAIERGGPTGDEPCFETSVFLTSKPRLWDAFEGRAIWLFSTARSGSTWLASDVIAKFGETRLIDESGVGRMFAPLQWDAERFFAERTRDFPIARGGRGE